MSRRYGELRVVIDDGPSEDLLNVSIKYRPLNADPDDEPQEIGPEQVKLSAVDVKTIKVLIGLLGHGRLEKKTEHRVLGENLYATLFYNESRSEPNKCGVKLIEALRDPTDRNGASGLLRITLDFRETRHNMTNWPWEYLYVPFSGDEPESDFFIGQRERLALTRACKYSEQHAEPAEPPLRILLVAPSSDERRVDSTALQEGLQELERDGQIELTPLVSGDQTNADAEVTFREFSLALQNAQPHIIHFLAHGRFRRSDDGEEVGQIAFADRTGTKAEWRDDKEIAMKISSASKRLHLVFFQACESAQADTRRSFQTVSGTAMHVSQKRVPAVIAMRYRVEAALSNEISLVFYKHLAEHRSILLALEHVRTETQYDTDDESWAAFGLPALYLRGGGVIPMEGPSTAAGESRPGVTLSVTSRGQTSTVPAGERRCPWHPDSEVPVDADACPRCERPLRCGTCGATRLTRTSQCKNCDAPFRDPETLASRGSSYEKLMTRPVDLETTSTRPVRSRPGGTGLL